MDFYLHSNLLIILLCFSCKYSSVEIKPKLQKNVLKLGYGIDYKYEGMLAHAFDRIDVVTRFILPSLDDLKLSSIKYDKECNYLHNIHNQNKNQFKENIRDLLSYCAKLRPYMAFYKMQIKAHNKTTHHICKNNVDLKLPKFPKGQNSKRGISSAIISGFVALAVEGISSFLHNIRHKALHKAVKAMSIQTDIQRNKLVHLENILDMYGVYNAETLERLVKTVHALHSRQTLYKNLLEHMNIIHKCTVNEAYSIMYLIQCYI